MPPPPLSCPSHPISFMGTDLPSPTTPHQPNSPTADAGNSSTPDSGIVYDSATLRLSVKDKIRRLRQSQVDSDVSDPMMTSAAQEAKKKAMSLPKDAKLPDNSSSGGE